MDGFSEDSDSTGDVDEGRHDNSALRTGIRRNRPHKNGLPPPLLAGIEGRGDVPGVTVKPFGEGRVFSNSIAFLRAWGEYEAHTFTKFTSRGSCLVPTANKNWIKDCAAKGVPEDSDACQTGLLPEHLCHSKIVRRCKYGIFIKSRGTGEREVQSSSYLACDARLTVEARKDKEGNWVFVTRDEYHHHNHDCDQAMLDSNGTSALLSRPEVVEEVHRMIQARAPARNICDSLATNFNIHITPKQLANIKRDRLGGFGAMANLKLLLARFASFPDSNCVLLDDQEGQVCGVIMQSASQKTFFQRFGDNVILDWTHNTNNLGFYLGSLMVTSVSGRGVSVCDFLCLEQTESMMTTVFESFIANNPGATEKIKSFVIDKDYKEWRVLQRVFAKSVVLLCQFHVIRWFAFAITMRKYNIAVAVRERVFQILVAMIYSRTTLDFELHQAELEELLEDDSPNFLAYMQARWYNCRAMWSDCERSLVFTALNTTSNRIESSWNQVKRILGKMLRVDLCAESIFAYMTAVLRREYRVINQYAKRVILRSKAHEFMRATAAELSEYTSEKVLEQWDVFARHDVGCPDAYTHHRVPGSTAQFRVGRGGPESTTYAVDSQSWTCSCEFQVTSALPCRHLMHIAKNELGLIQYPPDAIPSRWRMRDAFDILPLLKANARDIQTLRTGLLLSNEAFNKLVQKDYTDPCTYVDPGSRRITYVRLSRAEVQDIVVLNNLEKRNVVESQFAPLTKFMMAQSTPVFLGLAQELETLLEATLAEWMARTKHAKVNVANTTGDESDDTDCDTDDDEAVIAHAIDIEESAFADADAGATQEPRRLGWPSRARANATASVLACPPAHPDSEAVACSSKAQPSAQPRTSDTSTAFSAISFPSAETAELLEPSSIDHLLLGLEDDDYDDYDEDLETKNVYPCGLDTHDKLVAAHVMKDLASREVSHRQRTVTEHTGDDWNLEARGSVSSISASCLSERTVSEIVGTVAAAHHRPPAPSSTSMIKSMSSADISRYMTALVPRASAPTPTPARGVDRVRLGPTSKRKSEGKVASVDTLKELLNSEDGTPTGVQLRTLPPRLGQGQTKKQKTTTGAGVRLTVIDETSAFPCRLDEFATALAHTSFVKDITASMQLLPVRLTEKKLEKLEPVVRTGTTTRVLNYNVPKELLNKMMEALRETKDRDAVVRAAQARGLMRERGVTIDLSESGVHTEGYVVQVCPSLRGFSEVHISQLRALQILELNCRSYAQDMFWLQKNISEDTGNERIPYLLSVLSERAECEVDEDTRTRYIADVNFGAREQARIVLGSCTPSTAFHIQTSRRQLQSTITVREIVGYLCRTAKLNDSIMTYALRQMAIDFKDVHVFDCHVTASSIPTTSLADLRSVVFPMNIDEKHWCVACVQVMSSAIDRILIYDPLQCSAFEGLAEKKWNAVCKPVFERWCLRDGCGNSKTPEFVRLVPQKDGSSCGVYCAAFASELMSGSTHFRSRGEISTEALTQMRVCILWRILCGSRRQNHPEQERSATKTLKLVSNAAEDNNKGKTKALLPKKTAAQLMKKKSRT